ncbi:MAG TPA: GspMb/PilO family protein [Pyrinomonadaceae bacterium]|nr:GspMb/PilO family protein [Pyrinomonadaceae bacterium]
MSDDQLTGKTASVRRKQIRVRVDRLRQSRQRSILGMAEIAGLAGSAVMLLAVVFVYLYFYSPAQSRLATAQLERARLQQNLSKLQKDVDVRGSTQDNINEISQSLEKFESERLVARDAGRLTLYNVFIQLIRSNGLRNTSGPVYNYLEAKDSGASQTAASRTVNSRWQSLYPGIAVTVTVEGQYANLRHFVRDIEASNQFIIINAVELERASDVEGSVVSAAPEAVAPPARPTLVSLRLDMAAYFRRDAGEEVIEQTRE